MHSPRCVLLQEFKMFFFTGKRHPLAKSFWGPFTNSGLGPLAVLCERELSNALFGPLGIILVHNLIPVLLLKYTHINKFK